MKGELKMLKKFKRILGIGLVILSLVALVGCGQGPVAPENDTASQEQNTKSSEAQTITLVGSDSMQTVVTDLAELFEQKNEGKRIEVSGGGSGASFEPVRNGIAQIGLVSRELKKEESDITATVIGIDGIGVVVNKNNPIKALSIEQIAKIYAGEFTNWKEVGGKDQKITVIAREAGSGTTGAFEEIVLDKIKKEIAPSVLRINQSEGIRATVAKDEGSIGFFSLYIADESIHVLDVEGVQATSENVKNGSYKLQRPFNFIYTGGEPKDSVAKEFLDFALSAQGQKIIEENGLITVK